MCLGIPGRILKTEGKKATADFGGTKREIRLDLVDAVAGDWVVVHTGYAIEILDKKAAEETLKYWKKYLIKSKKNKI